MKKRRLLFKFYIYLLTAVIVGLTGCAILKEEDKKSEVTLNFLMFGTKPDGMEEVLEEFYNRTKDTLGIRINMEWVDNLRYKTTRLLKMNAKEEYDLVFDAYWSSLSESQKKGWYTDLEEYFNNTDYPGLMSAFSENIVENNKVNGQVVTIPILRTYGSGIDCVYYRKDLAREFGMDEINSLGQLEEYLSHIKERKKDIVPLSLMGNRGFYSLNPNPTYLPKEAASRVYYLGTGVTGLNLIACIDQDFTGVEGIAVMGDEPDKWLEFPEGLQFDFAISSLEGYRNWRKYCDVDSINENDPNGEYVNGRAGAIIGTVDDYEVLMTDMKKYSLEAEIGVYILNSNIRNFEERSIRTNFTANNYLCIPEWSTKKEYTIQFLDWLFSSKENHELFELGIEGVHWRAMGEERYQLIEPSDGKKAYNFPGYSLTWNPNYVRFQSELPEDILEYKKYELKESTFYKDALNDFKADIAELQAEVARVSHILDEVWLPLRHGMVENPTNVMREAIKRAREEGINEIEAAVYTQLEEFLKQLQENK